MPTNDFKPIAQSVGATVDTQATFLARVSVLANGLASGILPSTLINKILRQVSAIGFVISQYIVDLTGQDALDNGDNATLLANFKSAIAAQVIKASRGIVIDNAVFAPSVSNGEVVRWDNGNSRYTEAIADGTSNNAAVGVADVTNAKVYAFGDSSALLSGLTPGSRYYLSGTTPGAITTTMPPDAVTIGIAKSATTLFVDVDTGGGSGGRQGFYESAATLNEDYTVTTNNNAMRPGPLTLGTGYTITVPTGSTLTIVGG